MYSIELITPKGKAPDVNIAEADGDRVSQVSVAACRIEELCNGKYSHRQAGSV